MKLEDVLFLIGGGSIATLLSMLFQHFQKNRENKIDWYDRAVAQVKTLDDSVAEFKALLAQEQERNRELTKENMELNRAIMKMEISIDRLKGELETYEKTHRAKKKGGDDNGDFRTTFWNGDGSGGDANTVHRTTDSSREEDNDSE